MRRVLLALVATALLPAAVEAACEDWVATLVSVEGSVQARRAGTADWTAAAAGERYCLGDSIRALARSRGALVLRNDALLRLDQSTTVTFTGDAPTPAWVDLLQGVAHFFSRLPRSLKVLTPFVNGTVEGTEFAVEVAADRASITVFQGRVNAENATGQTTVASGQTVVARPGQPPTPVVTVRPRDAVQWALFYPAIDEPRPESFPDVAGEDWPALVRRSIEAYRRGDLAGAFAALGPPGPADRAPAFLVYRAGLLLTVGRVDDARPDLERALSIDPRHGSALALQSVIALVQNDASEALRLARLAVDASPTAGGPRIALSYAQQARFDLRGALDSVSEAVKLDPQNALAWARLSELSLSFGRHGAALDAASRAAQLSPTLARTKTVLGFAHLADMDTRAASRAFEEAIARAQGDPLPRLGLGLSRIRRGNLEEGRRDIEIAVGLDPGNALLRSYLGKAYDDERREDLAPPQFAAAEALDPRDPTPLFYGALHEQHVNEPARALQSLSRAIELNDNRAIYRSRLLLDEDLAVRSASLARIYDDLGFRQLALAEATRSVTYDPTNSSAHRFLADSYSALPRHEVARVSEVLQTQLLQPLNSNPVPPQLALDKSLILSGTGPSTSSFNEFNPLFTRDKVSLLAGLVAGNQGTFGDEAVVSGLFDRVAFSLGQFHYQTDGFRANNDLTQNIYNAFVQAALTRDTSVQAEYRFTDVKTGDLQLSFDPDVFSRTFRERDRLESIRVGGRQAFTPSATLLASFIYQWSNVDTTFGAPFEFRSEQNGFSAETLYLHRSDAVNVVGGLGGTVAHRTNIDQFFETTTDEDISHAWAYLYTYLNFLRTLTVTAGLGGDRFRGIEDRDQINPKFGVTWNPVPSTTVRLAAFRTLNRTITANQTLEPTQVAGFNQFYNDGEGARAWRYGIGVDQTFSSSVFAGVEQSWRRVEAPVAFGTDVMTFRRREQLSRGYLYWTPLYWLSLGVEYQYERFTNEEDFFNLGAKTENQTHRVPLSLNVFLPWGFISRWQATYVDQHGDFSTTAFTIAPGSDRFWLLDGSVGYRLPWRLGIVSLEARNLLDKQFHFQDTDPFNPRIRPERLVLGRLILAY